MCSEQKQTLEVKMVKNSKGGNKGKKMGRKHLEDGATFGGALRIRKEEGELYAVVVKVYGGANSEVFCEDGKTRMCIIRNKFRGRGMRGNEIKSGVWVMVGMREWEGEIAGKLQKCDLLEVYSESDKKRLISDYPGGWGELTKAEAKIAGASGGGKGSGLSKIDDVIEWVEENDESAALQEVKEAVATRGTKKKEIDEIIDHFGEKINIDDI
jgi:initiation factor 1A